MIKNPNFEIISVSNDYMAIPLGEEAISCHGVFSLSEASAFLLKSMTNPLSKEDMLNLLLEEYDIDKETAEKDLDSIIEKFVEYKLIIM